MQNSRIIIEIPILSLRGGKVYSNNKLNKIISVYPVFTDIILSCANHDEARSKLLSATKNLLEENENAEFLNISGLQFSVRLTCYRVFRQFLSLRSVKLTGFDLAEVLFNIVHKRFNLLPPDLSDGFLEDLYHILAGIAGKAKLYEPLTKNNKKGRTAAIARSESLNELCESVDEKIASYKCGLEPDLIVVREKNKERIKKYFNCSELEFSDYKWQLKNIIRDVKVLEKLVRLTDEEKEAITEARKNYIPFGITPYYASLFDYEANSEYDRPVRTQVIPPMTYVQRVINNQKKCPEKLDFMKEADTSPIDLITRRYPKIVVFKPYNTCSQICVYCQRNWEIDDAYAPNALAPKEKIDAAIKWIKENPAVNEVLLTGGDPLVMDQKNFKYVLESLCAIKTVQRIRIGTRTPVVLPQRITETLTDLIALYHVPGKREIAIVTHFEHTYEITPEAMAAIQMFKRKGISCYNQAVFTIQNCRRFELSALRKWLKLIGVEPYYTFNAKGKKETDYYRVPLARLQQEAKEEARLLPGLARTDEPVYNVPGLGKNYLRAEQNHLLLTILPNGNRVYEFHPWEKHITNAQSYIHEDICIYDFLRRLEKLGENKADYRNIYYYF